VGHITCMREMRNAYKIFVCESERKGPFGRSRHKWKDNIKTELMRIRCKILYWNHLVRDKLQWWALVNTLVAYIFGFCKSRKFFH
jgi:hypothetical protein